MRQSDNGAFMKQETGRFTMPKHLSLNGETAVCGPYMGGLTADSYTTDPESDGLHGNVRPCWAGPRTLPRWPLLTTRDMPTARRSPSSSWRTGVLMIMLAAVGAGSAQWPGQFSTKCWASRRGGRRPLPKWPPSPNLLALSGFLLGDLGCCCLWLR